MSFSRAAWGIALLGTVALCSTARADGTEVGKVTVLEGKAGRFADSSEDPEHPKGARTELKEGDSILLHDVIQLDNGNAKIVLNDNSVIVLGEETKKGSKGALLAITEADFNGQVRSKFGASLIWGKVWSHVTKALSGSDAKFDVTTPRAVAGVRGTIFRVDAVQFVTATQTKKQTAKVRVDDGKVGVDAKVKTVAMNTTAKPGDKSARHEVAKPGEVSKEEWERKFVELQKGMEIAIDDDLGVHSGEARIARAGKDDFDRWVDKHQ